MSRSIALTTLVVDDYDRAIDFYVRKLGFEVRQDVGLGEGKRWVVVQPVGSNSGLLLAKAQGAEQVARIGNQAGGRVFLFLHTDDFAGDYARMTAVSVHFRETPRQEPYGTVAVFEDLYGNGWDLIEPRA